MRDDPIALLERELLDAAHRRAVLLEEPDASSHEPRGPWPHASRPARRRSSLGAFAAVMMAGLALAVVFGALTSLHGHKAADGHVIRSVGGAGAAAARPRPAPETTLPRTAERDPSTSNRVWVTPAIGGPHTVFKVHFRVLLNNADYSYRLSGTRCPAITPSGGGGGGTYDLRGRIWSDSIGAVHGQAWCPGTYHLSVAVMGRANASPFGTATFKVIR